MEAQRSEGEGLLGPPPQALDWDVFLGAEEEEEEEAQTSDEEQLGRLLAHVSEEGHWDLTKVFERSRFRGQRSTEESGYNTYEFDDSEGQEEEDKDKDKDDVFQDFDPFDLPVWPDDESNSDSGASSECKSDAATAATKAESEEETVVTAFKEVSERILGLYRTPGSLWDVSTSLAAIYIRKLPEIFKAAAN